MALGPVGEKVSVLAAGLQRQSARVRSFLEILDLGPENLVLEEGRVDGERVVLGALARLPPRLLGSRRLVLLKQNCYQELKAEIILNEQVDLSLYEGYRSNDGTEVRHPSCPRQCHLRQYQPSLQSLCAATLSLTG